MKKVALLIVLLGASSARGYVRHTTSSGTPVRWLLLLLAGSIAMRSGRRRRSGG